jgi:hypothetical protein
MDHIGPARPGPLGGRCLPAEELWINAKVSGIMRVAGFVRCEDGTWIKAEPAAPQPTTAHGPTSSG